MRSAMVGALRTGRWAGEGRFQGGGEVTWWSQLEQMDLWRKEMFQEVGSILEISPYGNLSNAWKEISYFLFSIWGNDAFRYRELIVSSTKSFKKKNLNHIKTVFFRKTPFCGYRETFTFTHSLLTSACDAVLCNSFSKIIFCVWENQIAKWPLLVDWLVVD